MKRVSKKQFNIYAGELEMDNSTSFPETQLLLILHILVLSFVCSLNECCIFGSKVQSISGVSLGGLFDLICWMQTLCFQ